MQRSQAGPSGRGLKGHSHPRRPRAALPLSEVTAGGVSLPRLRRRAPRPCRLPLRGLRRVDGTPTGGRAGKSADRGSHQWIAVGRRACPPKAGAPGLSEPVSGFSGKLGPRGDAAGHPPPGFCNYSRSPHTPVQVASHRTNLSLKMQP